MAKLSREMLLQELDITVEELANLIERGMLIPDRYYDRDNWKYFAQKQFADCYWPTSELERFYAVAELVKPQQIQFYRRVMTRLVEMESTLLRQISEQRHLIDRLYRGQLALMQRYDKSETMIDAAYFCKMTGYARQTFLNNVIIIDPRAKTMRLGIKFYKDLVWHKIKNKWQTPLSDFMELRSKFNYQVYIDERKRRGEFIPRPGVEFIPHKEEE